MNKIVEKAALFGIFSIFISIIPAKVLAESISETCSALLAEAPITVVVPNDAGGGYDTYARAFASGLEALTGDTVRVANMPAASGRLAYTEVVKQGPDEIVLLVDNLSDLVAAAETDEALGFTSDAFAPLGTIISEPSVWLGMQGVDLTDPDLTGLIVGANAISSSLIDAGLVGRALGLNMRVVAGFDGSSETAAAVMRDETDIAILTITTALRRAKGTDLEVLLVLQDEAHAAAPDALVLGGVDGLVNRRAEGLSDSERKARTAMAEMANALAGTYRGVVTASHLEDDMVACLRATTDAVLQDETFIETAVAQGRPVDPIFSEQTIEIFEDIRLSQAKVSDELDALAAELAD